MGDNYRKVHALKVKKNLERVVEKCLEESGICKLISSGVRVSLKPNLTYPFFKKGVTTSPEVVEATIKVLRNFTDKIAIVESDGGYGAWKAETAFEGHGLLELGKKYGVDVVNLMREDSRDIRIPGYPEERVPLPVRLLDETDLFITMPVPKIHCMTGVTLALKNQWGCIPDQMRLRRHYIFDRAIVEINRRLRPAVLSDGLYFLDVNGPMEGEPVSMNLIIGSNDAFAFDRYVVELMGIFWRTIPHLVMANRAGELPKDLDEICCNEMPETITKHKFKLNRSIRNYIALGGFKSKFLTWFGYESWFGRVVLHSILYAIAGKPVKPHR